ncbi:MAG: hypothetical protein ACREL7_14135, partial [Longimicrobiales bacterium]
MLTPDERAGTRPSRAGAAEALIRSLVGVADARVGNGNGRIDNIRVVLREGATPHQVARNVASAVMAHFGQLIDPASITIHDDATDTDSHGRARADTPALSGLVTPDTRPDSRTEPNGYANGSPNRSSYDDPMTRPHDVVSTPPRAEAVRLPAGSPASPTSTPGTATGPRHGVRLESVDLTNTDRGLRCRVTVAFAGNVFTGIGDGPNQPADATDLAARVTIDALRAARCPDQPMQLVGTSTALVAGQVFVVTAVNVWNGFDFDRVSGAEPV